MNLRKEITRLSLSSVMLALGLVLPFLTGQIPEIGNMLLPMHLPVFITGFLCGPFYGAVVGLLCPLVRSLAFGMPPMYPTAIAMAVELMTYGLVSGLAYNIFPRRNVVTAIASLIIAMVIGRGVWGVVQYLLLYVQGTQFTLQAFLAGAFITAYPGIIIQLVLIPLLLVVLDKCKIVRFTHKEKDEQRIS